MRKLIITLIVITLCGSFVAKAELPSLSSDALVETLLFADQQIQNMEVEYQVDEYYPPNLNRKFPMPQHRSLHITYLGENDKYYYDTEVTLPEADKQQFLEWTYSDAFNGSYRTQWSGLSKTGDIFANPHQHAFPLPLDFGLIVGKRNKLIGKELSMSEIKNIRNENLNGHECYYVEAINSTGQRVEIWLDPAAGWRARQVKLYRPSGDMQQEMTADFQQDQNGIWFPVSGIYRLYGNSSNGERIVSCERNLQVKSVALNQTLTSDDFTVQFPFGAKIYDHIVGIGYELGKTSLEGVLDEKLDDLFVKAQEWTANSNASLASAKTGSSRQPSPPVPLKSLQQKNPMPKERSSNGSPLSMIYHHNLAKYLLLLLIPIIIIFVKKRKHNYENAR